MARRELAVWTAHHSNGWDTHVAETGAGEFAAWAAPRGVDGVTEYVEMDEPSAKAAAFYSLERRTGHTHCPPECSPWELHTHLVNRQPADLDDRAVVQESLTEEHERLAHQMRLLEQEHAALHDRPEDLPAHREHRTRLRQHIAQLRAYIRLLRRERNDTL